MKSDKLRAQAHRWLAEAEELAQRSDRLRDAADTILDVLDLDETSDEKETP